MKYLLFWVIFCYHYFAAIEAIAQDQNNLTQQTFLNGYILSKDSLKPISNASVLNYRSRQQTISNPFGYFKIAMKLGDTVSFTSVGYAPKYFYFKRDLLAQNYSIQVLMSNDTVELKTFVFKEPNYQNKLRRELDSYLKADSLRAFEELSRRAALKNKNILYNAAELYHPVTYFYERFNRQARNWRKIDRYRYVILKAQEKNFGEIKNATDDYYAK